MLKLYNLTILCRFKNLLIVCHMLSDLAVSLSKTWASLNNYLYLKEKQKMLALFYEHSLKNQINPFDYDPSDIVKSCLTPTQIHQFLKYDFSIIQSICHTLRRDGNITIFEDDQINPFGTETYYRITPEGKKSHLEKYYLRLSLYRSINLWLSVIAIVISIIALFT